MGYISQYHSIQIFVPHSACTRDEFQQFVEDALASYGGGCDPADLQFNLVDDICIGKQRGVNKLPALLSPTWQDGTTT